MPLLLQLLASICSLSTLAAAADSLSTNFDTYGAGDPQGTPFQTYLSNPDVKPPELQINGNRSGLAPGYVFIGVDGKPTSGQNWPAIYDMSEERMGTLVWTGNYTEPFDFRAQMYKGQRVLTFFSGELLNGYGHGSFYVLNESYIEIAHFSPVGYENLGDLHEFQITADDTALVAVYTPKQADLSSVGGPANGWIFDNVFQEIDIETGDLIFEWSAQTHIPINETYNELGDSGSSEQAPFDYFHINSVDKDADGNYLVSARVMDCIYKINGTSGAVIWRLQGKLSDFEVDPAASFAFQHDARWINGTTQDRMTLFSNGPTATLGYSRGLLLAVDQDAKTVSLIQDFTNTAQTFAMYEGGLQAINPSDPDTNYMVGYGSQPFLAECNSNGDVLLDVQFGKTNAVNSYRAFKLPWTGKPLTNPDLHYDATAQKVYLSWNGATDVQTWVVYTANASDTQDWTQVANKTRTGFETEIDVGDVQGFIRGRAISADGQTLGWTGAGDGETVVEAPTPSGGDLSGSTTASGSGGAASASASPSSAGLVQVWRWEVLLAVVVGTAVWVM